MEEDRRWKGKNKMESKGEKVKKNWQKKDLEKKETKLKMRTKNKMENH